MRKIVKKLFIIFNLIAVILLLLSYLSGVVSPKHFTIIQFFSLAYFLILIINIAFVFFWSVFKSKWLLLSLLIILLGWKQLKSAFQINFHSESEKKIKLISYNVRAFDRFDWTKKNGSKEKIFRFIQNEQPDIICYQEFFSKDRKGLSTFDTLLILQKAKEHHLAYYKQEGRVNLSGVATFSTYPIVNRGELEYDDIIFSIYTDLQIGDDTIRLFNSHLQSIHFAKNNYDFLENLTDTEQTEFISGLKSIYQKINKGFKKRAVQASRIRKEIDTSPYPVIVCGDFNDTPFSFSYNEIRGELFDAFEQAGNGFGFSYEKGIMNYRIDFVLFSNKIIPLSFSVEDLKYSDHYPVKFIFSL